MKLNDIFALKPLTAHHSTDANWDDQIYGILEHHLGRYLWEYDMIVWDSVDDMEIRIYRDVSTEENDGGSRVSEIGAVYWKGLPVFLYRDAGRGGGDANDMFIAHANEFGKLIAYLNSLPRECEEGSPFDEDVYDPNEDVEKLGYWYCDKFERPEDIIGYNWGFGDEAIGNVPFVNPRRNLKDIYWRSRHVAEMIGKNYEGVECTQVADEGIEKLKVTYPAEAIGTDALLQKLIQLAQMKYGRRFTSIEDQELGQFTVVFT